jgi:hypothetical protein
MDPNGRFDNGRRDLIESFFRNSFRHTGGDAVSVPTTFCPRF